jgi:FO synthase
MHAVARLHYAGFINNIQASWVKMGTEGARALLEAGVNDIGGTLMEESISRAAGAQHGQELTVEDLAGIASPLDRPLWQRNTLYERVEKVQ